MLSRSPHCLLFCTFTPEMPEVEISSLNCGDVQVVILSTVSLAIRRALHEMKERIKDKRFLQVMPVWVKCHYL